LDVQEEVRALSPQCLMRYLSNMPSWSEIEAEAPELATRAREIFDAHVHKTLATLRRDGSPRISGTEIQFGDGELWFGSMPNAMKALDLRRDPRFAIHSGSEDPPDWNADAKVAGRAEEIVDREARAARLGDRASGGSHLFRADITELVVTSIAGDPPDRLVIESWHQGRGIRRRERT
jgi:hypothetical protein